MLHQGLEIKGGRVYLPSRVVEDCVIVKTEDAVWCWDSQSGTYAKISIVDGSPVTEATIKEKPTPKEEKLKKNWSDAVK